MKWWTLQASQASQPFQSSILIIDIATYRLPRGQCSENHLNCITMWEGRDGVTIAIFFPAYKGWTRDQLCIRRQPHKYLKWTKLCLGPNQTCLEAFLGFLAKTKMKAYTNLTVEVCSQIVARKSVAPASGNFWRRPVPRNVCGHDQEIWRKKVLVKYLLHRFCGRGRTSSMHL